MFHKKIVLIVKTDEGSVKPNVEQRRKNCRLNKRKKFFPFKKFPERYESQNACRNYQKQRTQNVRLQNSGKSEYDRDPIFRGFVQHKPKTYQGKRHKSQRRKFTDGGSGLQIDQSVQISDIN